MKKRRWVLLGLNLLLAGAILAEPGHAAAAPAAGDCWAECVNEWARCTLDGQPDCYFRLGTCFAEKCFPY